MNQLKEIKHVLWLIKNMFKCIAKGRSSDAWFCYALIKMHLQGRAVYEGERDIEK